jgi:hypothetical protein
MNILNFFFNVKSSIKPEDFSLSRYYFIWNHHSKKRPYNSHLEEITLIETNNYIKEIFPNRITKKQKTKLVDCVILFMRTITINYDYYPSNKIFKQEFHKIIKLNYDKIRKELN